MNPNLFEFDALLPHAHKHPRRAGVYLYLYHGRKNPSEQMDDWGDFGPYIGPLQFVHTTYADTVCIRTLDGTEVLGNLHKDLFPLDGMYYGDWSVFVYDQAA